MDEAIEKLREREKAGDKDAAKQLVGLLASQGRIDDLRERADKDDDHAAYQLRELLFKLGRADELRERADSVDHWAALRLADLLASRGQADQALDLLRDHVDTGAGPSCISWLNCWPDTARPRRPSPSCGPATSSATPQTRSLPSGRPPTMTGLNGGKQSSATSPYQAVL